MSVFRFISLILALCLFQSALASESYPAVKLKYSCSGYGPLKFAHHGQSPYFVYDITDLDRDKLKGKKGRRMETDCSISGSNCKAYLYYRPSDYGEGGGFIYKTDFFIKLSASMRSRISTLVYTTDDTHKNDKEACKQACSLELEKNRYNYEHRKSTLTRHEIRYAYSSCHKKCLIDYPDCKVEVLNK